MRCGKCYYSFAMGKRRCGRIISTACNRPSSRAENLRGTQIWHHHGKSGLSKCTTAYSVKGSRRALSLDASFADAFTLCKTQVRNMDLRFVEETDPLRQALLEIYVAVVLGTRYNDFDTH